MASEASERLQKPPVEIEFTVTAKLDYRALYMWTQWAEITSEGDFKGTSMGTQGPMGGPPLALVKYRGKQLGFCAVDPMVFTTNMLNALGDALAKLEEEEVKTP